MPVPIVLASASRVRAQLLANVGVRFTTEPARIDEDSIKQSLAAEGVSPRDQADALAEAKALRVARRVDAALVIGSDQVLDLDGEVLSKPSDRAAARQQIVALRGRTHVLHTAAVIVEDARPVWRHVGSARLTMHDVSDSYLDGYLDRNAADVITSVGAYQIEKEGLRLFSNIEGDYFTILGLPLLEILGYLSARGVIET